MGVENVPLIAFNRGLISPLALSRIDLKRTAMSSQIQTNWMPRVLGSQMLRPGLAYTGASYSNLAAIHIPFIYSTSDKAVLEFTDNRMRVKLSGTAITYPTVTTAVTNGTMGAAGSWTDTDEAGGTSAISGGYMTLISNGVAAAIREQVVTCAGANLNVEHCLKVVVTRGPITFSVGSATGTDDYVTRTSLGTGTHYLAFTPSGNFYVRLSSTLKYTTKIDSCEIVTGELGITTSWNDTDLQSMRWDQSADVIYVACRDVAQFKIERRTTRSWSIVNYEPTDGPFRVQNLSSTRITPSAVNGDITLTASSAIFKSTNVGSLYRLPSVGQYVTASITAAEQWTDPIRVTGIATGRVFSYSITGTWAGTVRMQYSIGEAGSWVNFAASGTFTANAASTYDDNLDNQIVYYRIGIDTAEYTSGTAVVSLTYDTGSITGVARVTAYTSETSVSAVVVQELGGTGSVLDWAESDWSSRRGYPSAVALYEGRLWWAGKSKVWGSVSDAYEGFDPDTEGDSAPISRSIGSGPIDIVNFLLALQRLILGTDSAEWPARSTSFDEPLTASNFSLKSPSTHGSANVPAVKIDDRGLFVERGGTKLYQLAYGDTGGGGALSMDYVSADLCEICPEIGQPGIVRIAVQRQPDTRVHCVLADGRVAVLVSQPAEEVKCWLRIETDGMVEDVFTLPGTVEDEVYYLVRRRIGGSTVRYLEKWALESECIGGTVNKQADSFVLYDSTATGTLTGLDHLEGESVVCWGDGIYQGEYIVASGSITLDGSVTVRQAITGKDYEAPYLSGKLAYAALQGTALTRTKKVDHVGLVLANTHASGLQYGSSLRAKVNNFLYSDQFDNAKWTKTESTISANAVANPLDAAVTADKLVESTNTAEHLISQTANLRQTDHNTFTVYAKAAGRDYIRLKMSGDAGTVSAFFNLSTGAVVAAGMDNTGTGTGIRAKITDIGSSWYRCEITGICDTDGTFGVLGTITLSTNGSTISYDGDAASGVYIFRAQIEPGKKATDPIITTVRKAKEYLDLEPLPEVEDGRVIDEDEVWDEYDQPGIEFPGSWTTDSRIAFVATAPKPCTMLAAVVSVKTDG